MRCRLDEKLATYTRNDRFFCITGEWYFSTREDLQVGPFPSRDVADIELALFIRHINEGGIYPERYTMHGSTFSRDFVCPTG